MKVYEVHAVFYVTAQNDVDAWDVFENAIAPFAPENTDDPELPTINSMYPRKTGPAVVETNLKADH